MSTKLAKIIADFQTSLATEIAVGGTSATLQSATDDDGVSLPAGTYFFTVDIANSGKEHLVATLSGTSLTGISSISRQGVQTSGVSRKHRVGATVEITDFAHIRYMCDLLDGTTSLNHSAPLGYDGTASITTANQLATKAYVDGTAISGAPNADTSTSGISKIATGAQLAAGTGVDGGGATLVPTGSSFKNLSAGSGDANKVPVLDANGLLDQTFLDSARTWSGLQTFNAATVSAIIPPGMLAPYAGYSAPSGWLLCDGAAVSRSTYAALFAIVSPAIGAFTVTIATPAVVTLAGHGLATGDSVYLTTTGALPTGLSANTRYWVVKTGTDTFNLASSLANALAATKINTTGSQSGVHTAKGCAYGLGDGSTTFNTPSLKGIVPAGRDSAQTEFAGLGQTGGEKTHVLTVGELAAHHHVEQIVSGGSGGNTIQPSSNQGAASASSITTADTGSDTAHNNLQPYLSTNYIIKT